MDTTPQQAPAYTPTEALGQHTDAIAPIAPALPARPPTALSLTLERIAGVEEHLEDVAAQLEYLRLTLWHDAMQQVIPALSETRASQRDIKVWLIVVAVLLFVLAGELGLVIGHFL